MYYLTSTNKFYDGQKFESLADAKEKADIISAKGFVVDVWALNDRETTRCIYRAERKREHRERFPEEYDADGNKILIW